MLRLARRLSLLVPTDTFLPELVFAVTANRLEGVGVFAGTTLRIVLTK